MYIIQDETFKELPPEIQSKVVADTDAYKEQLGGEGEDMDEGPEMPDEIPEEEKNSIKDFDTAMQMGKKKMAHDEMMKSKEGEEMGPDGKKKPGIAVIVAIGKKKGEE